MKGISLRFLQYSLCKFLLLFSVRHSTFCLANLLQPLSSHFSHPPAVASDNQNRAIFVFRSESNQSTAREGNIRPRVDPAQIIVHTHFISPLGRTNGIELLSLSFDQTSIPVGSWHLDHRFIPQAVYSYRDGNCGFHGDKPNTGWSVPPQYQPLLSHLHLLRQHPTCYFINSSLTTLSHPPAARQINIVVDNKICSTTHPSSNCERSNCLVKRASKRRKIRNPNRNFIVFEASQPRQLHLT